MLRAYSYRLYPNTQQDVLLKKHFGCVRLVYNTCLHRQKSLEAENKAKISRFELQVEVKDMKKGLPFLKEANSQSLQYAILNLDRAYTNFYEKRAEAPRFKKKYARQSFHCPQYVSVSKGKLIIPKFREGIGMRIHRSFSGEIRNATISRNAVGEYYVSILVETGKPAKAPCEVKRETAVGIDVGLKHFAVLSDGTEVPNPRYLKSSMEKIKVLQRRKDKKQKGSANRRKAAAKVARYHHKVANQRKDFQQKLSTSIIKTHDVICVEDLAIDNMVKNHHLAGSIHDAGWGGFIRMLEYKAEREGKWVLKAGRFDPSSKRHYDCGYIYKDLSLKEPEWTCPNCGKLVLRDFNGSVNVKEYGLERYFSSLQKDRCGTHRRACGGTCVEGADETGKVGERAVPATPSHRL